MEYQVGRKLSEEHKEKLRVYAKENNIKPPESTHIKKRVAMLDKESLEIINEFKSISDACVFIGKTNKFVTTISSVCNGKRKTAFGYKWKFL